MQHQYVYIYHDHVGIEQYLQHYPDGGFWVGQNFVFDKREAVSVDNKNGVGGIVQSSKQQQQQQKQQQQQSKNCNSSTNNTDDNINNKKIIDDDEIKKRKLKDDSDNNNDELNNRKNIDIKRTASTILGEIIIFLERIL